MFEASQETELWPQLCKPNACVDGKRASASTSDIHRRPEPLRLSQTSTL